MNPPPLVTVGKTVQYTVHTDTQKKYNQHNIHSLMNTLTSLHICSRFIPITIQYYTKYKSSYTTSTKAYLHTPFNQALLSYSLEQQRHFRSFFRQPLQVVIKP